MRGDARRASGDAARLSRACSCCQGLSGGALPATAAPTWLAPHTLSGGPTAGTPQIATDALGDVAAVWADEAGGVPVIKGAFRPAGGGWSAPAVLSDPAERAQSPQVALGAGGRAVVVWERVSGGSTPYTVEAVEGDARRGVWRERHGPPSGWTTPASEAAEQPRVAVNASGAAVAAWQRLTGGKSTVEVAAGPAAPVGALFGPPQILSETVEDMHPPALGIAADGSAVLAWEDKGEGGVVIRAARRPAGSSSWSSSVRISRVSGEGNDNEPRLAMNERGDTAVVWERFSSEERIEAASLPAGGGAWLPPHELSTVMKADEPGNQQIAVDGQGRAVAVWLREGLFRVEAAAQSPTGAWEPAAVISPEGIITSEPALAVDPGGDAVAAWVAETGKGLYTLQSARRPAGAGWTSSVALPAESMDKEPSLATDFQGDAVASWTRYSGTYGVQAAGLDAAGPLLDGLSIPASGIVGRPLAFTVSPLDTWSGISLPVWSFGDGATASSAAGTPVSHTYNSPGAYRVTLTAPDVLGNASTASATVNIGACPVGVPPACEPVALTRLTQEHSRWREGRAFARLAGKARIPIGTSFTFKLNEPAQVTFTFTQTAAGRRVKGRCMKPARSNAHRARCTRTLVRGTLSLQAGTGSDRVLFQGLLSRSKRLAPGSYRVLALASEPHSSASSPALSFTIVR